MATRVMLRAGFASLHWHGSRHGQPSVIADVRPSYAFTQIKITHMNTEQKIIILAKSLSEVALGLELALLNLASEPGDIRQSDRYRMQQAASKLPELLDTLKQLTE